MFRALFVFLDICKRVLGARAEKIFELRTFRRKMDATEGTSDGDNEKNVLSMCSHCFTFKRLDRKFTILKISILQSQCSRVRRTIRKYDSADEIWIYSNKRYGFFHVFLWICRPRYDTLNSASGKRVEKMSLRPLETEFWSGSCVANAHVILRW